MDILATDSCKLHYFRRKTCAVEYKAVLLCVCSLVLIIFLLSPNPNKNSQDASNCKPFCNQSGRDTLRLIRGKAQLENKDEFLQEVLKTVSFKEVNLFEIGAVANTEDQRSIQIDLERIQDGLGENGTEAKVPAERKEESEMVFGSENLNKILSDYISFQRSLPDFREPECKVNYTVDQLPTLSVIIPFFNEPFSLLLRTIHSVFNRTPGKLLKEVVLVDDLSDHSDLHGKLSRYLSVYFPVEKVRLVRLSKRGGMIRARMIGAHCAIGDVLVFLDAQCEVTDFWAEPLLERVKENRTRVVSPQVDEIDKTNFKYYYNPEVSEGGFRWSLGFNWESEVGMGEKEKMRDFVAKETPVMMGGLLAVERKYFWEIGSYDPGMLGLGAENVELSFRVWQCGGSVEIVPCSRVGHVFRDARPYSLPANVPSDVIGLNTARVAEVWMDDYKELYYEHSNRLEFWREGDGRWADVSLRKEFRNRKNCKSFRWYLDNVYPKIFRMQFDSKLNGQFVNIGTLMCLDSSGQEDLLEFSLEVFNCQNEIYPSQTYFLSNKKELRLERSCATADTSDKVKMIPCENREVDDEWEYTDYAQIYSKLNKKCLTVGKKDSSKKDKFDTILKRCVDDDLSQQWMIHIKFENYDD